MCSSPQEEAAHIRKKWLHNPCLLEGPQCATWGVSQKWPKFRKDGDTTLAFSGVSGAKHGDKIRSGRHVGKMGT